MTTMLPPALLRRIAALLRDRRGATAIEHGLLCVLVALALLTALHTLADGTNAKLEGVRANVSEAVD